MPFLGALIGGGEALLNDWCRAGRSWATLLGQCAPHSRLMLKLLCYSVFSALLPLHACPTAAPKGLVQTIWFEMHYMRPSVAIGKYASRLA